MYPRSGGAGGLAVRAQRGRATAESKDVNHDVNYIKYEAQRCSRNAGGQSFDNKSKCMVVNGCVVATVYGE